MKLSSIIIFLFVFIGATHAAKEPKSVANARKSVVSVLTYKDGTLLRSGTGVFVGDNGEILSSYSLFVDADSAVAIDVSGVVRRITRVVGADDMYDCIKVRVPWDKKISSLTLSNHAAQENDKLYRVLYGAKKSGTINEITVSEVNTVSGCPYYTFSSPMQERFLSAPIVNVEGLLVALMQPVAHNDSIQSYALGASFANRLGTTALTYGHDKYSKISIPLALPTEQKEALTTLYLLQAGAYTGNAARFLTAVADYNAAYEKSHEGHMMLAEYYVYAEDDFDRARREWTQALVNSDKHAEIYYNISKIFGVAATDTASDANIALSYVDSALTYIDKALINANEPLYVMHKAELLYAKGDYASAFENYAALTTSDLAGAELFASAANCKNALGEYDVAVTYMDSAVATFGALPVSGMAPYIIERALIKHRAGRAREAVLDYNTYASLRGSNLNARFYFIREQAEYDAKMFQQALDDIDIAIQMMPQEPMFLIEKGRVCFRVKMVDEAIEVLLKAKELAGENPDVYYMLARCYMVKNDNERAKEYMLMAHKYGHYDAESKLKELEK